MMWWRKKMKVSKARLWLTVAPTLIASAVFLAGGAAPSASPANADSSDELKAAPSNYKLHYEDDHIRLVEHVVRPGETEKMHTNPYPAVIAHDAAIPKMTDSGPAPAMNHGPAPKGEEYPTCDTTEPEGLHALTNNDSFPLHEYIIEYKRVDGDDYSTNWKKWYPWMLDPIPPVKDVVVPADAKHFSAIWPYNIAYDSYKAAPNNHRMRYQDEHVRFLEVIFHGGERENLHGHPYYSVFEHDSGGGMPPSSTDGPLPEPGIHLHPDGTPMHSSVGDIKLEPNSPLNNQDNGTGKGPAGMKWPVCNTAKPQAPHKAFNQNPWPSHFNRIEFTRVDGDGIKTHWKEWYPWMAKP
jgi:hypothetical protein